MTAKQEVATVKKQTPVEVYTDQIIGDRAQSPILTSLPAHVRPDRFERNLVNLCMQNPAIMQYDPRLTFREVSKAAALGLLLDPQLGEAYVVPSWNSKKRVAEPQLRIGYRGLIKLCRQAGNVAAIYAHEYRENDFIEVEQGDNKHLAHKPNLYQDRGKALGYYAVIKYKDGYCDFDVMSLPEVHAIRDRSDAWQAYTAKRIKSTPWATDPDEMGKKTVLRRLLKRQDQSPDLSDALAYESRLDTAREIASPAIEIAAQEQRALPRIAATPSRKIHQSLNDFANPVEDEAHPFDGEPVEVRPDDESEAAGSAAPPVQALPAGGAAPLDESKPEPDAPAPNQPDPIETAKERGAAAAEAGLGWEVPRELRQKGREEEAQAYVAAYNKAKSKKKPK
jgi:recombination protein RecT